LSPRGDKPKEIRIVKQHRRYKSVRRAVPKVPWDTSFLTKEAPTKQASRYSETIRLVRRR
jgi:hypothetical protein